MLRPIKPLAFFKTNEGNGDGGGKVEPKTFDDIDLSDEDSLFTDDEHPEEPGDGRKNGKSQSSETTQSGKKGADGDSKKDTDGGDDDEDDDSSETDTGDDKDSDSRGDESDEEPFVTIDDKGYTFEQVKKALEDVPKMQQASTQKYQEAANLRKGVEPLVNLLAQIREKGLLDDIKDAIADSLGDDGEKLFDAAMKFDSGEYPNPFQSDFETAQQERDQALVMLSLRDEMDEIMDKFKISKKKANEVFDFALEKHKDGKTLTLEEAFIMMDYPIQVSKAKAKAPGPKVPNKTQGAKSVDKQKSIPKSFDEIQFSEEEEAALFE